jgi:hypothetical protein
MAVDHAGTIRFFDREVHFDLSAAHALISNRNLDDSRGPCFARPKDEPRDIRFLVAPQFEFLPPLLSIDLASLVYSAATFSHASLSSGLTVLSAC